MGEVDQLYIEYAKWNTPHCLDLLLGALTRQARAVIWQTIRQRRPDIENECLMRAVRGLAHFRGDSKLSTWFHRIVVNRCKTTVLKEARRKEVALEEAQKEQAIGTYYQASIAIGTKLKQHERDLLQMKQEDWDDTQICEKLNITHSTLRSRWRRLRIKIQKLLQES